MKKQVRVRVTDYTYERLRACSKSRGIPMAYLVRIAISDYLEKNWRYKFDD